MPTLNRILFTLLLPVGLVVGGCASQSPANNAAAVAQSAPVDPAEQELMLPVNEAGQPLVARVNGKGITKEALDRGLARYAQQQMFASDAALRDMVLNALIDQELINQAAAAQDIAVTDAEVQAELEASKQIAGSSEAWAQWLADNGYTEAEFRDTLQDALLSARMRDAMTQNLDGPVPHVHARHILVATESAANEIMARLQNGEEFAALAAAHSLDVTTREQGGDLGWFAPGELLEPYLAQVAFSTPVGELAGPVATSLGFHVVQTLEREERVVSDDKRAALAQNQFEVWLQTLRDQAVIEVY